LHVAERLRLVVYLCMSSASLENMLIVRYHALLLTSAMTHEGWDLLVPTQKDCDV
jgi:hypothetical protein